MLQISRLVHMFPLVFASHDLKYIWYYAALQQRTQFCLEFLVILVQPECSTCDCSFSSPGVLAWAPLVALQWCLTSNFPVLQLSLCWRFTRWKLYCVVHLETQRLGGELLLPEIGKRKKKKKSFQIGFACCRYSWMLVLTLTVFHILWIIES